jgi:hypothetical protein
MLDSCSPDSALSEISLLRVLLMRLLAASRRRASFSLKRHLSMLAAFGQAGLILASLVRYESRSDLARGDPVLEALAELDPEDL